MEPQYDYKFGLNANTLAWPKLNDFLENFLTSDDDGRPYTLKLCFYDVYMTVILVIINVGLNLILILVLSFFHQW